MKHFVVTLCLALLSSSVAVPVKPFQPSALDLLTLLENIVEDEGHTLITKVVHLVHKVEDGLLSIKNLVPKVHDNIHKEVDEVLAGLKVVAEEIKELLGKKDSKVLYGFGDLFDLAELAGGTKLSTVISLIQLAAKAHKVAEDAKEFVPKLEKQLTKIQATIEIHYSDLTSHVLRELGLEGVAHSAVKDIEDLVETVEEEAHKLILHLIRNMEEVFDRIQAEYPKLYEKIEHKVEEIRQVAREAITDMGKLVNNVIGYSLLDIAGDMTGGTNLGLALKVASLIEKFNTVVQDVKNVQPRAEVLLKHSMDKFENSAEDLLKHVSELLAKSM